MDYAIFVKKDMEKRSMGIAEYANFMGVTADTVYRWRRGSLKPSKSALLLMQFTTRQISEAQHKLCRVEGKSTDKWRF